MTAHRVSSSPRTSGSPRAPKRIADRDQVIIIKDRGAANAPLQHAELDIELDLAGCKSFELGWGFKGGKYEI